jgi:hypothetical protein
MDKNTLCSLVEQDKSLLQIASELNVPQSTLRYWMNKHGVSTKRNRSNKGYHKHAKCHVCGEDNLSKFYGHKRGICGKCQNAVVTEAGRQKKQQGIDYLGGQCCICGYATFACSLDFHHIDGSQKDENFAHKRGWKWERLKVELDKCVLLCRN